MLPIAYLVLVACIGLPLTTIPAFAQSPQLLEAAKKEGKAVIYGSLESDTMDVILQGFKKKTGIDAEYWRASATKVMDRAMTEFRAGKAAADAIVAADNVMRLMQKEGFFQKYDSPTNVEFPKDVIDPNLGPRYRNVVVGVVYNKSALKPNEYPKSLEDLAKPQYKGRIVMPEPTQHTTTTQWLARVRRERVVALRSASLLGRQRGRAWAARSLLPYDQSEGAPHGALFGHRLAKSAGSVWNVGLHLRPEGGGGDLLRSTEDAAGGRAGTQTRPPRPT